MLTLEFNPIETMIETCNEMFRNGGFIEQDVNIKIISDREMNQHGKVPKGKVFLSGMIVFREGQNPEILINDLVAMMHMPEVIAHEMAHAIAGANAGHGEFFEAAFGAIMVAYKKTKAMRSVEGKAMIKDLIALAEKL